MLKETLNQLIITTTMPADQQVEASRKICNQYIEHLHFVNIINAIVAAAEKEGGFQNINLCGSRKRFRDCQWENLLCYNDNSGSTKTIEMEK